MELLRAVIDSGGLWAFLSLCVQVGALLLGVSIFYRRRARLHNVNFTFAVVEDRLVDRLETNRQLRILVRNLSGADVLVGSALLRIPAREAVSPYADGDSAANEYELKFQQNSTLFNSPFIILRSGDDVQTFLPLRETVSAREIVTMLHGHPFCRSVFCCKTIILTKRPRVVDVRITLRNIQHRPFGIYGVVPVAADAPRV